MKLPTIYKKTKTGKTQEWTIEIEGDSYRTISGQTDGKKVVSAWTKCTAKNIGKKNELNPEQQALAEANAERVKKLERGYFEDIDNIDQKQYFEPMLAKDYKNYKDEIKYPVYMQPKLDGIRCICKKDGMFTRSGKSIISAPHIMNQLADFFDKNPSVVLDGELYNHDLKDNFDKIVSLCRKEDLSKEELKESEEIIQYHIYDCFLPDQPELVFTQRQIYLLENNLNGKNIQIVYDTLISNEFILEEFHSRCIENGFEGSMIRLNEKYENKRSKFLLKYKEFDTTDFVILGTTEGIGNRAGTVGNLSFEIDGKKFDSNVKGDRKYITKLWKDKNKLIGKTATIKHFRLTPDGIPRFPYVIAIRDYE